MKKILISIVVLLALAFTFAGGFLEELKMTEEDAHVAIWDCFLNGSYYGPSSPTYHSFSAQVQVAMVKEIGAFAKAYSRTDDFKKRYLQHRETQKPVAPPPFESVADMRKKQHDAVAANLKDLEAKLPTYTGDLRKTMDEAAKMIRQQLKEIDDPNNPAYTPEVEAKIKKYHDESMKEYQAKVAQWDKEVPLLPTEMIQQRLNYFIQLSSTVDFNAKLTKGPENTMVFVNPDYEQKDADWKYIYRSGKEPTNAARAIAIQWLGELK